MPKAFPLLHAGSSLLTVAANSFQSPLLLIVRLYWGWSFFQTGLGKLKTHGQVAEFFTSLHIPLPGFSAWLAGGTECFGGLLLMLGLASRLTAIPLIMTMAVAYLTSEMEVVRNIFSEPDKFTGADPFLFLLASVIVFTFGPGALSLDRLVAWKSGFQPGPSRFFRADARPAPEPFVSHPARAVAS